jgi:hypothetical protein
MPSPRSRLLMLLAVLGLAMPTLAVPTPALATGEPVALQFQVQPGDGPARAPLPRQPVVRVVDADGNTVTTSTAAVSLTRYGDGPVFGCNENPVRAINGVATFQGCSASDGPKAAYRIRATAYHLDAAISDPFDIGLPAPPPDVRLIFEVGSGEPAPFTATAQGSIWFDVRVRVADSAFQRIVSGPESTLPVTLSMAPNPEGAMVSCPGGETVNATAGEATFTDCSISKHGFGLRFVATAHGAEPGWSYAIDVWPPGTPRGPSLLALAATQGVLTWGANVQLQLRLQPTAPGQALAGRTVHLQLSDHPFDPDSQRTLVDVTTDADGAATFTGYRPISTHWYRAFFEGAADLGPAVSQWQRVIVRYSVVLRPTGRYPPRRPAAGTAITFRVIVRPARPDTPLPHVLWEIRHFGKGDTPSTSTVTTNPDALGNTSLPITFTRGSWVIRVRTSTTATNANSIPTFDQYIAR